MAAHINKDLLPYYKRKYTEYEITLRTQLADDIDNIVRDLNRRTVLRDHQLKSILTKGTEPEDRVSALIGTLKQYQGGHFGAFMECLTSFGHDELVRVIKGESSAGPVTRSHTQQTTYQKAEYDTVSKPGSATQPGAHNEVFEYTEFGSMKESHKIIWISKTERIVKQLQHELNNAMMRLYQAGIIDLDDKKRINKTMKEKQEVDAARELVDLLRDRGDNVLERIIRALKPRFDIAKELEYELNH